MNGCGKVYCEKCFQDGLHRLPGMAKLKAPLCAACADTHCEGVQDKILGAKRVKLWVSEAVHDKDQDEQHEATVEGTQIPGVDTSKFSEGSEKSSPAQNFISSDKYTGKKTGYIFKKGQEGSKNGS